MGCAKTHQGIQLLLEKISEISANIFVFVSLINRCPSVLKQTYKKHIMPERKLLVFIFHDGNREHFAQIGEV